MGRRITVYSFFDRKIKEEKLKGIILESLTDADIAKEMSLYHGDKNFDNLKERDYCIKKERSQFHCFVKSDQKMYSIIIKKPKQMK